MLSFQTMNRRARHRHSVAMDCYINPPRVMFPWTLAYEAYQTEVVRFSLKEVVICPLTRSDDLMVLVRPIFDSLVPIPSSHIDEIFYVTRMTQSSFHPQYAAIMVFEETVLNRFLAGLADGVIYNVPLKPERLFPNNVVLRIPNDIIEAESDNADNVIQTLREEVTGPVNQLALANILNVHGVDAHTVLAALIEYFHDSGVRRT